MADNMCGPSNGAKNLLAHVDRDRALHQDRFVSAPQAGPGNTFRSQGPISNGAETAFGGFQQGGVPMDAAFGPVLDMSAMGATGPHGAVARPFGHPAAGVPATMGTGGPSSAAARLASPGTGSTRHEWADQFANMQLGSGLAGPSNVMQTQPHPVAMASAMNPAMNLQHHPAAVPFARPMFTGAPAAISYGFPQPMTAVTQQQPQAAVPQDAAAAAVDVEAFNRAFEEYDNANFETELADWAEKQKLANSEFAEAQDEWMAEHGPRTAQPPTAEEMKAIDANLEQLAKEQEKRRADDDLARAAVDIVNSVADNTSEKFKNSRFFELMRRIGNREVVVEGEGFVNVATGEAVVQNYDDDDDSGFASNTPESANPGRA